MSSINLSSGNIPTANALGEAVNKRVEEEQESLCGERKELETRQINASAKRKELKGRLRKRVTQEPDLKASEIDGLVIAFTEAAKEEVAAVHALKQVHANRQSAFHRIRARIYREAVGAMRKKAEAADQLPELKRKARNADKALEDLERILRRIGKGDFLFKSGPLDVFGSDLIEIKERLED